MGWGQWTSVLREPYRCVDRSRAAVGPKGHPVHHCGQEHAGPLPLSVLPTPCWALASPVARASFPRQQLRLPGSPLSLLTQQQLAVGSCCQLGSGGP